MTKTWLKLVALPGVLAGIVGVFVLVLLLLKVFLAWTVPDLFPEAVKQGLIAKEISWLAAVKVAIVIGVVSGAARKG